MLTLSRIVCLRCRLQVIGVTFDEAYHSVEIQTVPMNAVPGRSLGPIA